MNINQKHADNLRKALALSQKNVNTLYAGPFAYETLNEESSISETVNPLYKDNYPNIHEEANATRAAFKNLNQYDL
jgi:tRNA(Arg) A34 adenosine deaminase TadA